MGESGFSLPHFDEDLVVVLLVSIVRNVVGETMLDISVPEPKSMNYEPRDRETGQNNITDLYQED
jgi:hypothetical protein